MLLLSLNTEHLETLKFSEYKVKKKKKLKRKEKKTTQLKCPNIYR